MSSPFKNATLPIHPFQISHSQQEIDDLKTLLRLSPLGPDTFENGPHRNSNFGISMDSMSSIRDKWLEYDWFKTQDELNKQPQFIAKVDDHDPKSGTKRTLDIHFIGHVSDKADAIPVLLLHGWPGMGCFELAPMVDHLKKSSKQPLNIVIPSIPGYLYSSRPPSDADFDFDSVARVMHNLMLGLGYKSGYATQGGDLGSFISRYMAIRYKECKISHFNFMTLKLDTPALAKTPLKTDQEKGFVERYRKFQKIGMGYAMEHGTRPATIGFAVVSNPLSLAAWVGEKLLESWSPGISDEILLQWLTLFWLTSSFPTSIYLYRHMATMGDFTVPASASEVADFSKPLKGLQIRDKPMGYSTFPREIFPVPKAWAEKTGNLVFYRLNEKAPSYVPGGHFAGGENPELLGKDFAEFLNIAWPQAHSKL
ncbi:hypothetical protein QFC19_007748 [Naganishia cerealis]|uniref:Uncharacterized protein n=1 Tax=Naganishia cerealis TaxID=610337 RepID=A0ACC2V8J9_9TREE|nr:hypothetical protein QFC19_007748 [Naganishia cerealis]